MWGPCMSMSRKRVLGSTVDALALSILLTLADVALHVSPKQLLDQPLLMTRSFTWLALSYGVIVLTLSFVLRRREIVLTVSLAGFVLAQSLLWFERTSLVGEALFLGLFIRLAAGFLIWPAYRLGRRIPVGSRSALAVFVGGLFLTLVSRTLPISSPSPPVWPLARGSEAYDVERPNLLLITLDTVRPDRLGVYGYEGIRTPHLDTLAGEGALFLNGIAQAPITPPSHASILSGVWPVRHGLRDWHEDNRMSTDYPLLAELLRRQGYLTGALLASAALSPEYGLNRGFDMYQLLDPERDRFDGLWRTLLPSVLLRFRLAHDQRYTNAKEQADQALRWLRRYSREPFFLWVHFYDAHDPYNPAGEFLRPEYHPDTRFVDRFRRDYLYDSELLGVDRALGRILLELRKLGLQDNTVVAVISDHGEGLGDHGYYGHSARLFGEQLRLVLVVRYPKLVPAGVVVQSQVRSVDLFPTLLEIMDVPVPDSVDGVSLLPLLTHTDSIPLSESKVAFSETVDRLNERGKNLDERERGTRLLAVSDGEFKLIRSLAGDGWLFDLRSDPGELRNIIGTASGVEQRLQSLLDAYLALSRSASSEPMSDELRDRLRSLGYIN